MGDELSRELLDLLIEGVDRKNETQKSRLEKIAEKHAYAVTLGKDVVHHDDKEPKKEVREARDEIYSSMKYEKLDETLENWDNRGKRAMLLKDLRDIEMARPLMEGVKGASLVDKKFNQGGDLEV